YIGYGPQSITLCAQPPAASYMWSTGETTQCITVTTASNYSVIGYDANGCPSPTPAVLTPAINVVDIRCGQGLKKIILCHVPEGNFNNPQTLCIGPPAIPPHLELHRWDCLGPCSLYYRTDNVIQEESFYVFPHPNPFSNGFNLSILTAETSPVMVNIHDVLGRVVETYMDVTEQTVIGSNLTIGIYFAEVIQGDNRQMIQILKSE
ncbi:MAG: T9SS type A sorting domain-containing protein, partial [Bacteroidia bacterium]|nr:T9SS type A sorting domain-containing protein [Bacteroidia bacterium]